MAYESDGSELDELEIEEQEFTLDDLEADLTQELETTLSDLSFLDEEKEKIEDPAALGDVVLNEVWMQFGHQIGLDLTNETLIQAYNREHPETYKDVAQDIMRDERYKNFNSEMKAQQQSGTLTDKYTGQPLGLQDEPNLDHVVPRKELFENARRRQAGIDTKDLANKEENLAPTNEALNKSKGAKSNKQYIEGREVREESLKKTAEAQHKKIENSPKSQAEKKLEHDKVDKRLQDKLAADDDLMMAADKKARKAINQDIAVGVAKQTAKKAGKDALKMMAVTALFDLLKMVMNGLIKFLKEKQKTFKLFLENMKEAVKRFISHIASIAQTGATSAIGTVVSEIFGPIVSLFQKLASFIRQGVSTLADAIRYLTDKSNRDKPLEIKIAQVGKIVTAGLVAAGAIIGSELIEKALLQIPFMAIEIPLLGSIANVTGLFLASLVSGVVGAIVINQIDKFIAKQQRKEIVVRQISKGNEVLQIQGTLTAVKEEKLISTKADTVQKIAARHSEERKKIEDALNTIYREDSDDIGERLELMDEDLDALLG